MEHYLRELRLVPVMSGSASSGFEPTRDQNSIEACLENLRKCDAVIVILCRRYGPSLAAAGFPDISATHLEYNEAKKTGKPIHMYVRDRLEADYRIRKSNKVSPVKLTWIEKEEDRRLLDLLESHRTLSQDSKGNWFDTFRDSVELKALIRRDFNKVATSRELRALIVENKMPLVVVELDAEKTGGNIVIQVRFRNLGPVPAYRLTWQLDSRDNSSSETPVLAPQQDVLQSFAISASHDMKQGITLTYYTGHGHRVIARHEIGCRMDGNFLMSGSSCKSTRYKLASGDEVPFEVEE